MRILVLTNMYPPHHLGGYELSCRDCVERWRAGGHEVCVLTTTMRVPAVDEAPDEQLQGVHRELSFYWHEHEIVEPPIRQRLAIERRNQAVLARHLERFRPDVVSAWHMGAMSLGLLTAVAERGLRMVFSVCDDWLIYGPRVDPWTRMFLGRPGLGRIVRRLTGVPTRLPELGPQHAFCFNSDFVRRRALERSGLSIDTHTIVYSGIDPADFPVDPAPRPPWRWRLLCVGRQEERKGTHVAVAALPRLPEARLDIVGPGDERYLDVLRASAESLAVADRVGFDVVERSALSKRYAAADAFLFPVTWDEPFGLVPIEAMACGVPVIATGTGGSAEFLVDGVNCLLVPTEDVEALAAAVRRLADDPELRRRIVDGGIATATELTVDRLASVLEAWHEAVASRFASGRPADLPAPVASLRRTE